MCLCLCNCLCLFVGQDMSPHHSDQISEKSEVNWIVFCITISKVLSEWVSEWVSEWQGHLLSCSGQLKTLPEAQRTQDIESTTWIISKSWNECKFQFSTLNPPPLPGNHLPVILLAHHHLNDNRYLPMFQQHILSPTWSQLTSTPAPIFRTAPVPPPCRPPWWSPSPHWARPPSKWQPSTPNCPIGIIS